nr:PBSX family phage terminase large subunit [Enterococcus faecalis]
MALENLMTKKQIQVLKSYLNDDWKAMILSGAVRSGKTYIDNYIFLLELRRVAELAKRTNDTNPKYILAGSSNGSIYNNIISE